MASIKDLKKRIGTVKNTQQTTRAMKLVSAAKLRRAQDAIVAHRPYARKIDRMIRVASGLSDAPIVSPLIRKDGKKADSEKTIALLLVTSDRGLCGAFNGNIIKAGQRWMESNGSKYKEVRFAFVGRRGADFFKNRGITPAFYEEFGRKASFEGARKVSKFLIDEFLTGKVDEVKIVYNEFKNAIAQEVIVEDHLPLQKDEVPGLTETDSKKESQEKESDLYIIKPGHKELLEILLKRHFAIQLYRVVLESQASEHGARMSAMENATRNAGEMIQKLTLQFNKQRQAGITKELLEIISGSESQKQ